MNLGENIYKFRTGKNMSQGDLAEQLEVSRQSVSKWENNSAVPELDKLLKMAELFGITIDELVTGTEQERPGPVQGKQPRVINENHPESAFLSLPLFMIGILIFVFLPGHFISWLVGAPLILSGLFVVYIGVDAYLREKRQRPAPEKQADSAASERFTGRKIAGAICLGLGLLFAVVCVLLMILTGNRYEEDLWVAVILIGVPLAAIGAILLLPGKNQGYWACVILYLLLGSFLLIGTTVALGIGTVAMIVALGLIALGVGLGAWTVVKLRRGTLSRGAGIAVIVLLCAVAGLLVVGLQPTEIAEAYPQ